MNIKITLEDVKVNLDIKVKLSQRFNKHHFLKTYGGAEVFLLGSRTQNSLFHVL